MQRRNTDAAQAKSFREIKKNVSKALESEKLTTEQLEELEAILVAANASANKPKT